MDLRIDLCKVGCAFALYFFAGISASAGTIPFTFETTYDALLGDIPSPANLTVPGMNVGSGFFSPFGSAIYTAAGTVTFGLLPSGELVLGTVALNFTASFNGGADTFTGTDVHLHDASGDLISETMTILGGTGVFRGATGFAAPVTLEIAPSGNPAPGFFGTLATSGSGQITAPGLNGVPEPSTVALFSTGLAGLAGVAAIRRKKQNN
jgi:hypothetical protein